MTRRRSAKTPLAGAAALTLLAACGGPSPEPPATSSPAAGTHAHPLREVQRASRFAARSSACGMVPGEIPVTGQRKARHETPCADIGTPLVIIAKPKPRPTAPEPVSQSFSRWAKSHATYLVFRCESHWNPRAVNPSGKYRGLIQADAEFWASWGGLRYAPRPDQATTGEQLLVAYRAWKARGWQPWTCARIVGVR